MRSQNENVLQVFLLYSMLARDRRIAVFPLNGAAGAIRCARMEIAEVVGEFVRWQSPSRNR